ncbi:MAG: D-Ala-D-Ala carboxypeptidase family metallohydrolase [Planctomycetes bacterium]|nr:D-Ala-D-Ala carboxypeptidase family metallohydrolase [Planctomycetota bacterium]
MRPNSPHTTQTWRPVLALQAGRAAARGRGLSASAKLLLLVGACSLAAAFCLHQGKDVEPAPAAPPAAPPVLEAWALELPGAAKHPQSESYQGRYAPGEIFFVPAGAELVLRPQPEGAAGTLGEYGAAAWTRGGGMLASAADGRGLTGRAPARAGLYALRGDGAFAGGVQVLVLGAAEITASKDRKAKSAGIEVRYEKTSIGCYGDPCEADEDGVKAHPEAYAPPRYFARLDGSTLGLRLGDGLALGQLVAFLERRDAEGRKIITNERHIDVCPPHRTLVEKLNKLKERLVKKGVKVTTFWITSGFRTPDYNRRIKGATYSRHCYGDAVDLCIDENGDLHMDDLNGDGKLDRNDGLVIARACAELEAEGQVVPGGIGVYEYDGEFSVRSHVHIDCRGFGARWGISFAGGKHAFEWEGPSAAGQPSSADKSGD